MRQLLRYIILTLFLLLSPNPAFAYNNSWSSHEDVTTPCPGPGCEKKCKNPCGCNPDGSAKECECKPSPTVCCLNNPPTNKTSSPVYTKNGAFTWSDTDISLISKPSLALKRNYTAYDAHLGLFGNAWISDFEKLFLETVKYDKDDNGTQSSQIRYILRLPNGARYAYTYDANNNALIDTGKLKVKAKKIETKPENIKIPVYHGSRTLDNDLIHTKLDVRFNMSAQELMGKATLTLKPVFYPVNNLILDAKYFTFTQVRLNGPNGPSLKYDYDNAQINIQLGKLFSRKDQYKVYLEYTAHPTLFPRRHDGQTQMNASKITCP